MSARKSAPKAKAKETAESQADPAPSAPSAREKRLSNIVETSLPYLEELLNTLSTYGSMHRTKREFLRALIDEGRSELAQA